jgi:hypothetical protein
MHTPTEDESHNTKDNSLLEYFNAKLRTKDIFKVTVQNESLREINNDNGVRFATSENLIVKSTVCPRRKFCKYT